MPDPTQRFSNRVENYIHYRPRYPEAVIVMLQNECGLRPEAVIADVGSGTGFLAEMFLKRGHQVFGIEPNKEMREAGERLLREYPRFVSISAAAEQTTLPDGSVDFVTAGQAFHWFDRGRSKQEFKRILKPNGWVVLIWNDRRTDSTPFLTEYERLLLDYSTDYQQVDHKQIDSAVMKEFFGQDPLRKSFENLQHLDFPGLKGRLLSSSYVPAAGQPRHEPMLVALSQLYDKHKQAGEVTLEYDTVVFCGQLPDR